MKKKPPQVWLEKLPDCAAEFIKLVIKKMRYRKKVRADVQTELAAHFEDELKDCTNDQEKQARAEQLIADFGDAKLLGILLRRAKKRCRPLWRTIVVRTFQTAGVLILCLIAYTVWFMTGKPVIITNYVAELNRIVRPVADESLNAAPLYEKAIALSDDPNDYYSRLFRKDHNQVQPEEIQQIEQWIADNKAIFDLLIAGTNKPYYWQQYKGDEMMSILMPNLKELRDLAYAWRWRAQLRAEKALYQDAFDDIKSCYRMGQHFKGDKSLIEQLVGMSIESFAIQTLLNILSEYVIDSNILANLFKDFEQMIAGGDFVVSLETERLFIYDCIQRCFTEDRLSGGHLYLREFNLLKGYTWSEALLVEEEAWTKLLHILFTHPNKHQTREMADRYYTSLENMFRKTPAQIREEITDIEQQTMELINGNYFLEVFVPALTRVNEINYQSKTEAHALITILALLRYRQDKNFYPDNTDELITSGYFEQLPIDPFSDKPLVYKKTDDGFILYSVGRNFIDDDGKPGKDKKGKTSLWASYGDAVFWPVQN